MATFLLIRHGMTDVVGRVASGRTPGVDLNAAGRLQVERLAGHLAGVPLAAIVSSPLERAVQTAEPIAKRHELPVETDDRLNEISYGEWSGRTFQDLATERVWSFYNTARSLTRPPGGELLTEVQSRVVTALTSLAGRYRSGIVAIVSHADVIRAALQLLLGMPVDFVHRIEISPASISVVDLSESGAIVRQVNGDSAALDR
jgi:probable phosphoglycerate mutase